MGQRQKTQQRDCLPNDFDLSISRDMLSEDVRACLDGLYQIVVSAAGTINVTVHRGVRVIDAWCIKTGAVGGAGDTVTVQNAGTAITNAMDLNVADEAIVRAGTIADDQMFIAAGGTLRIVTAEVTDSNCIVYIRVIPATT